MIKSSSLSHSFAFTAVVLLTVMTLLSAAALATGCAKTTIVAEHVVEERQADKEVGKPTAAPAATPAPAVEPKAAQPGGDTDLPLLSSPYRADRMIIKNAEVSLLVADTGVAIDLVTQIATDSFGYILSSRTWYQDTFQYATITLGVPAEEFENVLRRLRGLGLKVLDESASGTDVTDEYVDLESRLRNLEATEARIRSFLDKATTVEESLKINAQLSDITAQIEETKGKMNYLKDRSAYSTITVHLSPEVPTPTPSPTPTTTPLPTPVAWRPGETFQRASYTLKGILRILGDMAIWLTVVLGPFVAPVVIVVLLAVYVRRRTVARQKKEQSGAEPPAADHPGV